VIRHRAYGKEFADALSAEASASFVSRNVLNKSDVAVTQIICKRGDNTLTSPVVSEDAFLFMVQARDWPKRILWEDGRPVDAQPLKAGAISIFDLRKNWVGLRVCPVNQVSFFVTRAALDAIAEADGVPSVAEFDNDPCAGAEDEAIWGLTQALLPAFTRPNEANRLFVDHMTVAATAHVLRRFGSSKPIRRWTRSLDLMRTKRVEEAIASNLAGDLTVADLAASCGMTITDFLDAFRASAGKLPYQRLQHHRVETAKSLLRNRSLSLAEIAVQSGFSGLGHFKRVFKLATTLTPARWRALTGH
jgi:AraC family transcriptional regulator